jgi:hypothetical protein
MHFHKCSLSCRFSSVHRLVLFSSRSCYSRVRVDATCWVDVVVHILSLWMWESGVLDQWSLS